MLAMTAAAASTESTPSLSPLSPLASLTSFSIKRSVSAAAESTQLYSKEYAEKLLLIFQKEIQPKYFRQGQNLFIKGN